MSKWFKNFPKLEFGLSPEYIAQTRQYVSRSYSAAILFSLAGIGLGLSSRYFSTEPEKEAKVDSTTTKKDKD